MSDAANRHFEILKQLKGLPIQPDKQVPGLPNEPLPPSGAPVSAPPKAPVKKQKIMADLLRNGSHAELLTARAQPGADQQLLAPAEHYAFAREWTQESPVLASMSLPFAIPAYTVAKKLGIIKARTPGTLEEMGAGYQGLIDGLRGRKTEGEG